MLSKQEEYFLDEIVFVYNIYILYIPHLFAIRLNMILFILFCRVLFTELNLHSCLLLRLTSLRQWHVARFCHDIVEVRHKGDFIPHKASLLSNCLKYWEENNPLMATYCWFNRRRSVGWLVSFISQTRGNRHVSWSEDISFLALMRNTKLFRHSPCLDKTNFRF